MFDASLIFVYDRGRKDASSALRLCRVSQAWHNDFVRDEGVPAFSLSFGGGKETWLDTVGA